MSEPRAGTDEGVGQRPDASMSLLREIMDGPRDSAYTDERVEGLKHKRNWFQEVMVLLIAIAIGTGGVWAARQLRAPVEGASQARTVLEEQITDRSALTEGLRLDIRELRSEISDLEHAVAPMVGEDAPIERAQISQLHAGTSEVYGPGVRIELSESSQPATDEERVLDVDLQIVANGLWAAGAEAITVNDHRLAFGTAIRTAGEVILVDLEPVQSPYVIDVIGNPEALTRNFAETAAAEHLRALHSNYRIKSTITQVGSIQMPAGNALRLTYAEPLRLPNVTD